MRHTIRSFLVALMLTAGLAASALAGPFEDGSAAYESGDHATALRLWNPLAEQGHAYAQGNLGFMYGQGQGVPQDYAEAVRLYRLAAEQGHAYAQGNLGFMYGRGRGVPQDYVVAHLWFNLAASQGHEEAIENRDLIAKRMTPEQIAEAQRLAREWKPK